MCRKTGGRITGNHVYAARLHDVRFRQLETGLPAQFQTAEEIKRQRKIHDKLIEKGLQLIADSFLDQLAMRCERVGVPVTRQLLEGINYEEIVREDGELSGGRFMVCVDGSSYSYKAMKSALELAQEFGASLYVCSAFDVEYHHVVFGNIKDVLSVQASKVFKFEEQEELHNNIIDKGLLKLCQANLKRAEVMAREFPDVEMTTQILVGKPFQVVMQWAEECKPSLLIV